MRLRGECDKVTENYSRLRVVIENERVTTEELEIDAPKAGIPIWLLFIYVSLLMWSIWNVFLLWD